LAAIRDDFLVGSGQTPVSEGRTNHREDAVPRTRKAIIAACVLGAILLLLAGWQWLPRPGSSSTADHGAFSAAAKSFHVQSVPSTWQLSIRGVVGAGRAVPVPIPFDGVIRDMKVQFGDRVGAGDILIVMDSDEIEIRLREARSSLLKAAMALDAMNHWETGPEVSRAKRTMEGAQTALLKLERQSSDTKALLDRGIVSRNEYDSLVQQRDAQKLIIAGAQQDLTDALKRGSADGRQLAELDLENAKAKLMETQRQFDGATIRAPTSGILLRPPLANASTAMPTLVDNGAHVQRGQTALMIADLASLIVSSKVDEVDINRIRIGQAVSITSDAFPELSLSGRIVGGSAEADQDSSTRVPTFNVRAIISEPDDAARNVIRIGMSARMTINVDAKQDTIIVPIAAVQREASGPTVRIIDAQTGAEQVRQVTLGATTPSGIEIMSGVKSGDALAVP
jgi:multidrug efflux pump subunit AcrA (membrane-fusion protein)